uniref:Uncharacterized protein n=1 Tax=Rhizophora mucronata TaxID=61149 RepID=A0A2P2PK65_RHIMU
MSVIDIFYEGRRDLQEVRQIRRRKAEGSQSRGRRCLR